MGESGNTEGTGEHLESRADHAALERKLREALRAHGFTSGPYARLVVLVYLTRAFEEEGYRLDLVKAHSQVSRAIGISGVEARAALRDSRKAGCFLSSRGQPLLTFRSVVERLSSDDALELDEICIDAMSRVARADIPALDEEPMRSIFREVVGAWPSDPGQRRRSALDQLRASSDVAVAPRGLIAQMASSLRTAGLDPVPAQRSAVIAAVIELVGAGLELTADQLAEEIAATAELPGAADVVQALVLSGSVRDDGGRPISSADEPVAALAGDHESLEADCVRVYRRHLEQFLPEALAAESGPASFERLVNEPPPISSGEVMRILDDVELHPETRARQTILAELLNLTSLGGEALGLGDLARAVADRIPVSRTQVWHMLDALRRADAILRDHDDPPGTARGLVRTEVGELDGSFWCWAAESC